MIWIEMKMRARGIYSICKTTGVSLLLCASLAGCAGTGNNNTSIPTSAQVNNYIGAEPLVGPFGGVLNMRIDRTTNYFNLLDEGYLGSSPINYIGGISKAGQFQLLSPTYTNYPSSFISPIYAVEVPGDTVALEFDSLSSPSAYGGQAPAVFAESDGCQTFSNHTFQLIQLGDDTLGTAGYGFVTVNAAQSGWTFSNFDLLRIDGTDTKPVALNAGACTQTAGGYETSVPATLAGQPLSYTIGVSPNGYFVMNRGESNIVGSNITLAPLVGVLQPDSPLDTGALMAANYAGFEYDYAADTPQLPNPIRVGLQPASFSGSNASQTQLVGGVYPLGDPTKTPSTDIAVTLGKQDPNHNGLYPSATVTFSDPNAKCVNTPYGGKSAAGNPICTFSAAAVAGNPGGKYVLFITVLNPVSTFGTTTMQFLLYQQ